MTIRSIFVAGAALLLIFGCGGNPVTRDELIGVWRIEEDTRRDLPENVRSADISLSLERDGRFIARQLPGRILFLLPRASTLLVDGWGVWSLGEGFGGQVLVLEFRKFQPEGVAGTGFTLNVICMYRVDNQPRLYFYTHGEDDGRRVRLKKQ